MGRKVLFGVSAVVALLTSATAGGFIARKASWLDRLATLERQAEHQAELFPRGQAVIFGDSITSQSWIPDHCGKRVLNAAIHGTQLPRNFSHVDRVIANADPATVIFAWGANDAVVDDPREWLGRYRQLVERQNREVVIVGIWRAEQKSAAFIDRANDGLRMIAEDAGAVFVEPPRKAETSDGIHPTTRAAKERAALIGRACPLSDRGSSSD